MLLTTMFSTLYLFTVGCPLLIYGFCALLFTTTICDPLEQFEVFSLFCMHYTNLQFTVDCIVLMILAFLGTSYNYPRYPSTKPNVLMFRDKSFSFVAGIIKKNLNLKALVFFPIIYLTFLFILLANLVGMVPYSFTVTSSAGITFFFSITFFIGITHAGYSMHKDRLFQILLPAGVPLAIAPFLIVVELISYVARVFSLAIRLFANMMSGHGLLKILGSFTWAIVLQPSGLFWFYVFPLAVVPAVIVLEAAIAFLQAYVFIVLVSVYLNDVLCIH